MRNLWTALVPILVAIISAGAVLGGYVYEKRAEREFEIHKKRQEIYTRFINNLARKLDLFEQLRRDPRAPQHLTLHNVEPLYAIIRTEYPALDQAMNEAREIATLVAVYGSDEAIRAFVQFNEAHLASLKPERRDRPDVGTLIHDLRRSLFPNTRVSARDVNLMISK